MPQAGRRRRSSRADSASTANSRYVSPGYPAATVHEWIRDLYRAAKEAAPSAWFTVSDTTGLYWPDHPQTEKYAGAVDFYDVHIYDPNPKVRDFGKLLGKLVILGEVGSPAGGFDDMRRNAPVAPERVVAAAYNNP